jgi:hypothetical protein
MLLRIPRIPLSAHSRDSPEALREITRIENNTSSPTKLKRSPGSITPTKTVQGCAIAESKVSSCALRPVPGDIHGRAARIFNQIIFLYSQNPNDMSLNGSARDSSTDASMSHPIPAAEYTLFIRSLGDGAGLSIRCGIGSAKEHVLPTLEEFKKSTECSGNRCVVSLTEQILIVVVQHPRKTTYESDVTTQISATRQPLEFSIRFT